MKVIVQPGGIIRELVPAPWWRRLLFRDTSERYGDTLTRVPDDAEITYTPDVRLSDLQAAGLTVHFVPR